MVQASLADRAEHETADRPESAGADDEQVSCGSALQQAARRQIVDGEALDRS